MYAVLFSKYVVMHGVMPHVYRTRFNFRGVCILLICNYRVFFFAFLNSRLLGTVVLKYSRVKYSQIYGVSPDTIIVYGTCRGAKLAGLVVGFV